MKYIALLRGINIGGHNKVKMKKLQLLFEDLEYTNVGTYINSGNVMFESDKNKEDINKEIEKNFETTFGFHIPTLIKTKEEVKTIAKAIPTEWTNDKEEKTHILFLFPEVDTEESIDLLPMNREYVDVRYTKGAIFWNFKIKNYNKSKVNKVTNHKLYKLMTMRNINTTRYLALDPIDLDTTDLN